VSFRPESPVHAALSIAAAHKQNCSGQQRRRIPAKPSLTATAKTATTSTPATAPAATVTIAVAATMAMAATVAVAVAVSAWCLSRMFDCQGWPIL